MDSCGWNNFQMSLQEIVLIARRIRLSITKIKETDALRRKPLLWT